jgi:hypothetical protein
MIYVESQTDQVEPRIYLSAESMLTIQLLDSNPGLKSKLSEEQRKGRAETLSLSQLAGDIKSPIKTTAKNSGPIPQGSVSLFPYL